MAERILIIDDEEHIRLMMRLMEETIPDCGDRN